MRAPSSRSCWPSPPAVALPRLPRTPRRLRGRVRPLCSPSSTGRPRRTARGARCCWRLCWRRRAQPCFPDRCSGIRPAIFARHCSPRGPILSPRALQARTAMSRAPCSRRPHGRQLARMRAGGGSARQGWSIPGSLRRKRPLRCMLAAPGARLCPIFRVPRAHGSLIGQFRVPEVARSRFLALRPASEICELTPGWRCPTLFCALGICLHSGCRGKRAGRRSGAFFWGTRSCIDKALGAAPSM